MCLLSPNVSPVSSLRQWQCLSFMTPCLPVHKVLLSQCCAHCSNVCVSVFTSRNLCVFLPSGTAGGKATAAAAAAGVTAGQQESSSSKGKAPGVHSTGAFQCRGQFVLQSALQFFHPTGLLGCPASFQMRHHLWHLPMCIQPEDNLNQIFTQPSFYWCYEIRWTLGCHIFSERAFKICDLKCFTQLFYQIIDQQFLFCINLAFFAFIIWSRLSAHLLD